MKNHYIYIIYDVKYDKFYIGKRTTSKPIEKDNYLGSGKRIKNIENYYKRNNLDINKRLLKEILEVSSSYEENDENEKKWIWFFNAAKSDDFYNVASGGDGGNTRIGMSKEEYDEYMKKNRLSLSLRFKDEGYRRQHSKRMKEVFSQEENRKTRSDNANKKWSKEENRIHQSNKIKEYWKNLSDDERKRISEKRSKALTGKKLSEETKRKISEKAKLRKGDKNPFYGKKHTKETIEKIKESQRRYRELNPRPKKPKKKSSYITTLVNSQTNEQIEFKLLNDVLDYLIDNNENCGYAKNTLKNKIGKTTIDCQFNDKFYIIRENNGRRK